LVGQSIQLICEYPESTMKLQMIYIYTKGNHASGT